MKREFPFNFSSSHLVFLLLLFVLFVVSFYLQSYFLMNWDVGAEMYEAGLFFKGGKYYHDFYELNPPMFFFIDYPIFVIKYCFPSMMLNTALIYSTLGTVIISLYASYRLCIKLFENTFFSQLIIFILAIVILFGVNSIDFATREQKIFIFIAPYFFLLGLRLEKKPVNFYFSLFIGICAAIGFSIKPYSLIPLCLVELYVLIQSRRISILFRPETISMLAVFVIYLIATYALYPEYLTLMVPQIMSFYYDSVFLGWLNVFLHPTFIFVCFIICFYLVIYGHIKKRAFWNCLLILDVGFLVTHIMQKTSWPHHIFPSYALSILLIIPIVQALYEMRRSKSKNMPFLLIILTLMFDYTICKNVYLFLILFSFMALGFFVALNARTEDFKKKTWVSVFSLMLAFYPLYAFDLYLPLAIRKVYSTKPLIHFLKTNAHNQSVYFLSGAIDLQFPAVEYAQAKSVSRFLFLFWLPAYLLTPRVDADKANQILKIHHMFVDLLAEDIDNKKPVWVLVDSSNVIRTPGYIYQKVSILRILLESKKFEGAWKNYKYVETLNFEPYYKLDIYKRIQ